MNGELSDASEHQDALSALILGVVDVDYDLVKVLHVSDLHELVDLHLITLILPRRRNDGSLEGFLHIGLTFRLNDLAVLLFSEIDRKIFSLLENSPLH